MCNTLFHCCAPWGDSAVVYYAGHGCEAMAPDGSVENYLIPVDERGVTDFHMASTAMSLQGIMAGFGRQRSAPSSSVCDGIRHRMNVSE